MDTPVLIVVSCLARGGKEGGASDKRRRMTIGCNQDETRSSCFVSLILGISDLDNTYIFEDSASYLVIKDFTPLSKSCWLYAPLKVC